MEHILRCNVLKCRKELSEQAVVTTCSHVFCGDCAERCQLARQVQGQRRVCPACEMHLTNADDVAITNLNPTEDYKTSILSGLSPSVIMECAGRALSFWAYQTAQEIVYQDYLSKSLTDKFSALNVQLDKIINDANGEISNLRNKLSGMQVDADNLRRKNQDLHQNLQEKTRKQMQTQELYDKLKRRTLLGKVQNAASDAVDHTIQESVNANRFVDRIGVPNERPPPPPLFPNVNHGGFHHPSGVPTTRADMQPQESAHGIEGSWAGFGTQGSIHQNHPAHTPSANRQRLAPTNAPTAVPPPRIGVSSIHLGVNGVQNPQYRSTPRQPLASLNTNRFSPSGFAGYGMSAGLKVSNPAATVAGGVGRPMIRSRVAQRQGSAFPTTHNTFGAPATSNMFSGEDSYY